MERAEPHQDGRAGAPGDRGQEELVGDDLVESVVRSRPTQHDWNYGFIIDGFPRDPRQAEFFLESYDIDSVIKLDPAGPRGPPPGPEPQAVAPTAGWTTT